MYSKIQQLQLVPAAWQAQSYTAEVEQSGGFDLIPLRALHGIAIQGCVAATHTLPAILINTDNTVMF